MKRDHLILAMGLFTIFTGMFVSIFSLHLSNQRRNDTLRMQQQSQMQAVQAAQQAQMRAFQAQQIQPATQPPTP